jgi:hypothetical protein
MGAGSARTASAPLPLLLTFGLLCLLLALVDGFVLPSQQQQFPQRQCPRHQTQSRGRLAASASAAASGSDAPKQATLDSRTPWLLSLVLTRDGFDPVRGELRLRFVETKGYEPPQVKYNHQKQPPPISDAFDD